MFQAPTVIVLLCVYLLLLFVVALWVEKRSRFGQRLISSPLVYTLSLAVYLTSWTYYGSVGNAVNFGIMFMTFYIGPTLAMIFAWPLMRRMIRIKNKYRITSISDFISARYGRSQSIAALVTVMAIIGIMPYTALQLKAIISSSSVIIGQHDPHQVWMAEHIGPIVVLIMIVFTVIIGARRLDPTERHQGMVLVVALESIIKLGAMLAVGLFVVFGIYDGFFDIFERLADSPYAGFLQIHEDNNNTVFTWLSWILMSATAFLFLPRQFHIGVVENSDERHVLTSMWLIPVYMLLMTIFIAPLAAAGLLNGLPVAQADTFVLRLPMLYAKPVLAMGVFIGGLSAATGMIMIGTMTLATMIANHLVLPLINMVPLLAGGRRILLQIRWLAVAGVILMGYWFEKSIGESVLLVSMGKLSFSATLQFAPAILIGIFYRRGNSIGAFSGLLAGFVVWIYTMLIPSFIQSGWLDADLLTAGLWGLSWLRPEQLFGLMALDPVSHSIFWSLLFNVGFYLLGSAIYELEPSEQARMDEFTGDLSGNSELWHGESGQADIILDEKTAIIESLFEPYLGNVRAESLTRMCVEKAALQDRSIITIAELAELFEEVRRNLSGFIGAATAQHVISKAGLFSKIESESLSKEYGRILAELNVPMSELKGKIDYYKERNELLTHHAEELEKRIYEREKEIVERKRAEEAYYKQMVFSTNLVQASPAFFVAVDTKGAVIMMNRAMLQATGYTSGEVVKTPYIDQFIPRSDRASVEKVFDKMATSIEPIGFESGLKAKDGKELLVEWHGRPVYDAKERLDFLFALGIDVTLKRVAENEKQALEGQLRQQQKLESIGTLASGVAHEINNPINVIMNYGQLISDRPGVPEEERGFAREVVNESERVAMIVRNLLAFSRQEAEIQSPQNLEEIVSATLSLVRTVIRKDHIELKTVIPSGLPRVHCRSQQIQQVLMNLLTNARDALNQKYAKFDPNKIIRISAERIGSDTEPWVRICVEDYGIGMTSEQMTRIFDPFYTTKPRGIGTGLGLSVSHGIIKEHGGRFWVQSEPGEYSRFYIELKTELSKDV